MLNKRQYGKMRGGCRVIETPYWNLMLDRGVLRIEERPIGHKSFIPQKVVRRDIWTRGLQRRHNSRQQSPRRKM
jgi:hypothetical protein